MGEGGLSRKLTSPVREMHGEAPSSQTKGDKIAHADKEVEELEHLNITVGSLEGTATVENRLAALHECKQNSHLIQQFHS